MYRLAWGKGELTFDLPKGWEGYVAAPKPFPPLTQLDAEIRRILAHPLDSPPLRELARPGQRVVVVIPDPTRPCPPDLPTALLEELRAAGIKDEHITILIGLGMHRPTTPQEKARLWREAHLLGPAAKHFRVVDHDPSPSAIVYLGETTSGVPVSINRHLAQADLVVSTGVVEPHQYAGYSGGGKTVAMGAAGETTIAYTHAPQMLDHPGVRLGVVAGNPFRQAVEEIAAMARLRFILNVVVDGTGAPVAVAAGDPQPTFHHLAGLAEAVYTVPLPGVFDVAIAGVGHPKDVNLYQASRAASNLVLGPRPVVRPGGVIIIAASCPEGAGKGVGEERFYQALKGASSLEAFLQECRSHGYPAGAQRAFIMAKVLQHAKVIVAGAQHPQVVEEMHMTPAPDLEAALEIAQAQLGPSPRALIVPHALHTIPIVTGDTGRY